LEWNLDQGVMEKEEGGNKLGVDVVFNCYVSQDFTRNTVESFLKSHVLNTINICKYLNNKFNIGKLIGLSSIYSQNYGYVTESDGQINIQPLGY
jgi:predicted GNAT superfamily acetyltransferase